jgi:hypothetical protein
MDQSRYHLDRVRRDGVLRAKQSSAYGVSVAMQYLVAEQGDVMSVYAATLPTGAARIGMHPGARAGGATWKWDVWRNGGHLVAERGDVMSVYSATLP